MAICSDCHHCVVASSSGGVYLYNFRTTEILDVFKGHNSAVLCALLTDDQQIAVTVSKVSFFAHFLAITYFYCFKFNPKGLLF